MYAGEQSSQPLDDGWLIGHHAVILRFTDRHVHRTVDSDSNRRSNRYNGSTERGNTGPGSTVNLSVSSIVSMTGGTYNLSYSVSGSGFSKSLTLPVTIVAQNILTLTASQMEVVMKPGTSSPVTLTTVALGSFKSAIAFTTTLPTSVSGLTVTLSKTSLPSPGSGTVVATINAASSVPSGNYAVQIAAIGGTCNESVYLSVVVANGPGFTFTINTSAVTIAQGASGSVITSSGNYRAGSVVRCQCP